MLVHNSIYLDRTARLAYIHKTRQQLHCRMLSVEASTTCSDVQPAVNVLLGRLALQLKICFLLERRCFKHADGCRMLSVAASTKCIARTFNLQFEFSSDVYRCSLVSAACSNVVALNMLTAVECSTQSTVRTVRKFIIRCLHVVSCVRRFTALRNFCYLS